MNRYSARPQYGMWGDAGVGSRRGPLEHQTWGSNALSPREKWNEHVQATNMRSQMQLQQFMTVSTKRAQELALKAQFEAPTSPRAVSPRAVSPRSGQQAGAFGSTRSPRQLVLKTALDKPPSRAGTPRGRAEAGAPSVANLQELQNLQKAAEILQAQAPRPATPSKPLAPIVPKKTVDEIKQTQKSIGMAVQAVNSHFSNMFKAFQSIDIDNSGSIGRNELNKALKLWNVNLTEAEMDALWARCDVNNDGDIDYKEFVDTLARDTVAPAAMGKRDMQAKEAMGVADLDPAFLGHYHQKNYKIGEATAGPTIKKVVAGMSEHFDVGAALSLASDTINAHFSNMFKAFQYIDVDGSGSIGAPELKTALLQWNVGLDDSQANELIQKCDVDGNGQISYSEFVDALARDTVAPSAMGKRDMQAYEAMGVHDLDPKFLGHNRPMNYKMED